MAKVTPHSIQKHRHRPGRSSSENLGAVICGAQQAPCQSENLWRHDIHRPNFRRCALIVVIARTAGISSTFDQRCRVPF
jgi:hypothetical protein